MIDLIGNTPLIKLKYPSELTGCNIYGKAEFMNPGGSVKDRAALGIIQDAEEKNMDILVNLEKDISDIEDADLASILTRIDMLMTQKEAAQATFTRITSKSLFDFLG